MWGRGGGEGGTHAKERVKNGLKVTKTSPVRKTKEKKNTQNILQKSFMRGKDKNRSKVTRSVPCAQDGREIYFKKSFMRGGSKIDQKRLNRPLCVRGGERNIRKCSKRHSWAGEGESVSNGESISYLSQNGF